MTDSTPNHMGFVRMTKFTEDQLCSLFAQRAVESTEFVSWLLKQTKFSKYATSARLLHQEQMDLGRRIAWWRHWWCRIPELERERETDIFMVFEADTKERFALHVENKKGLGRFLVGQAEDYRPRAAHMANKDRYMNYTNFTTVLLAPTDFRRRYHADSELFDAFISYEDVCKYILEFAPA